MLDLIFGGADVGFDFGGAALQRCGKCTISSPALTTAKNYRFVSGYAFRHTVKSLKMRSALEVAEKLDVGFDFRWSSASALR
jgi:hypothetical protein